MNEHLMVAGDGRIMLIFILEQQYYFTQALQLQPIPPHRGSLPEPQARSQLQYSVHGVDAGDQTSDSASTTRTRLCHEQQGRVEQKSTCIVSVLNTVLSRVPYELHPMVC